MNVEFDPAKSAADREKHGIDFEAAQALRADENLIIGPGAPSPDCRLMAVGVIGERIWSAVFTMCGDRIRLISVRHVCKGEARHHVER